MSQTGRRFPFRPRGTEEKARRRRRAVARTRAPLEGRPQMAPVAVTSLGAAGAGSLRQAIVQANRNPGPDTINFEVAGTIRTGRQSLPAITGPTTIDGSTAPGFASAPVARMIASAPIDATSPGSMRRPSSIGTCNSSSRLRRQSITAWNSAHVGIAARSASCPPSEVDAS